MSRSIFKRRWFFQSLVLVAVFIATGFSSHPAAEELVVEEEEPARAPVAEGTRLRDLLNRTGSERAQQIQETIEAAMATEDKSGAWQRLQGRSIVRLSAHDVALQSLKKNLSMSISRLEADRVRQAITEAESVFDPVFNLDFGYRLRDTFERTEQGVVTERRFEPTSPAGNTPGTVTLPQGVQDRTGVRNILFGTQVEQDVEKEIFASRENPNGAIDTFNYSVALTQQLPWGPSFDVSVVTTDEDVFYDNRGNSFDQPWTSDLVFNLLVPLPGGRNFGPYSVANTQVKLAEKRSELGQWEMASVINSTLLQVDFAYLDLLQSLENLLVATENRQILERQSAHLQRLYDARYATTFDKSQIDAALAGAKAQEAAAKNGYLTASDTLATLIESSAERVRDNVYLPIDYTPWLGATMEFDSQGVLAKALQNQPSLRVAQVNVEAGDILQRHRKVQTRPDVNITATIRSSQNGSRYGYDNYFESIGNIGDPDVLDQSYGIRYRYPWRNQALKARLSQAEYGLEDSRLTERQTRNSVENDINNALIGIKAARARMQRTAENLRATKEAYNSLARREEAGEVVNTNELITKISDYLNARLTHISATIDNKRSESSLLAAQGIIATHYAGKTARNGLERKRLKRLAQQDGFQYFMR